jgi:hypothetical protein
VGEIEGWLDRTGSPGSRSACVRCAGSNRVARARSQACSSFWGREVAREAQDPLRANHTAGEVGLSTAHSARRFVPGQPTRVRALPFQGTCAVSKAKGSNLTRGTGLRKRWYAFFMKRSAGSTAFSIECWRIGDRHCIPGASRPPRAGSQPTLRTPFGQRFPAF